MTVSATLGRVYLSTMRHARHQPDDRQQRRRRRQHGQQRHPGVGDSSAERVGQLRQAVTGNSAPGAAQLAHVVADPVERQLVPQTIAAGPAFLVEHGPPIESVYLVLILAALALLGASQAIRYLAVRLALGGGGQ